MLDYNKNNSDILFKVKLNDNYIVKKELFKLKTYMLLYVGW